MELCCKHFFSLFLLTYFRIVEHVVRLIVSIFEDIYGRPVVKSYPFLNGIHIFNHDEGMA